MADKIAALQAELTAAMEQQKQADALAAAKAKALTDAKAALEAAEDEALAAEAQRQAFQEAYGPK